MSRIKNWPQFAKRIRPGGTNLLQALPNYTRPILVAGCQRSGGTMLARAFTEHPQVSSFCWSKDAELDAALLLSDAEPVPEASSEASRYCFQTTYLNERATEYLDHTNHFHLIWLIRNPYSVAYSMLYNWKRFALNEVFLSCGLQYLPEDQQVRYNRFGLFGIKPLDRACYAWLGKAKQCETLLKSLPADRMVTLSYEDLVQKKASLLNQLYDFTELPGQTDVQSDISTRSMKKSVALSGKERARVEVLCDAAYSEHMESPNRLRA